MLSAFDLSCLAVASFLLLRLLRKFSQSASSLPLPPGPPGKPVVGNALDMPTKDEATTYSEWAKQYGDIVHVSVFGQPIIILNSLKAMNDLFEKRSSIYSDRSELPMLNDLMGFDWHFAFMHYGEIWRRYRKMFHMKFHPTASQAYWPAQTRQTRELLKRLHEKPAEFVDHLRHTAGAIIMEIIYGIRVAPKNDRFISIANIAMEGMSRAGNAGAFLVDVFPILKYIPEWIPGAGFQKEAKYWRQAITALAREPHEAVKASVKSGNQTPSYTLDWLREKQSDEAIDEEMIKGTAAGAYAAGSDTTVSSLHTFFMAMLLYPECQLKAQRELDQVVGRDRLPEFQDRDHLPYINALINELLRWRPVGRLGVPHRLSEEDIYEGYRIPAGSVVVGNVWNVFQDSEVYGPDPADFRPERFLKEGVKDPVIAWGFGRRICPGRFMADNSIFIAVASILQVFDISNATDANGQKLPVRDDFKPGMISHPEPFECSIKCRGKWAEQLLDTIEQE